MKSIDLSSLAFFLLVALCSPLLAGAEDNVSKKEFGTADGQPNTFYTLTNQNGNER